MTAEINKKPIFLGLDYGTKRTGVAFCDNQSIAFPLKTINCTSTDYLIDEISKIISEKEVTDVVLGKSFNLDGSINDVQKDIESFAQDLDKKLKNNSESADVAIHWQDERLTSHQVQKEFFATNAQDQQRAGRRVNSADMKADNIDARAATVLLQSFIDRWRGGGTA